MDHSPLKRLPPELRLIIYELVVGEPSIIDVDNKQSCAASCLAMTCRELAEEVMPVLLSTYHFRTALTVSGAHVFYEKLDFSPFMVALTTLFEWAIAFGGRQKHLKHLVVSAARSTRLSWDPWTIGHAIRISFSRQPALRACLHARITALRKVTAASIILEMNIETNHNEGFWHTARFDISSQAALDRSVENLIEVIGVGEQAALSLDPWLQPLMERDREDVEDLRIELKDLIPESSS